MMEFVEISLTFPVSIFSGLLILSVLYWAVAAFGILDIDNFDLDTDLEGNLEADLDLGGDSADLGDASDVGGDSVAGLGLISSFMLNAGLYGVPLPLIITFIAFFAWSISYFSVFLGPAFIFTSGLLHYIFGFFLMLLAFFISVFLTSKCIKPFRPFFKKVEQTTAASVCGSVVLVRSSRVDQNYGEAVYEDGGASMLLDVRPANEGVVFKRGDRAVVLSYDPVSRIYLIIAEVEFNGH